MNLRGLLAVSVAVTAIAVAGPAVAATSAVGVAAPAQPVLRNIPQVNLHQAFEQARREAKAGPRAGLVPPRGVHVKAQAASTPAGCAEPKCDLLYRGGPVQHSPKVYLVLWGAGWSSTMVAANNLTSFYGGLGVSPDDTWSTITSQYGDGSGAPSFGSSVYVGAWNDIGALPGTVTEDDLAAEANAAAAHFGITDKANAQVVIASESKTCFNDGFVGNCGQVSNPPSGYCGWHAMTTAGVPFTNLPYLLDAGSYCGEGWINAGSAGTYDGLSTIAGHEYAETITDPNPPSGWFDIADINVSGGENGDKCAWGGNPFGSDPYGDVTLSTGSFAMQSLWSNVAGKCLLTAGPGLVLTSRGTRSSTLGTAVTLQFVANSGSSSPLTYHATGLPPGLAIGTTGRVTGKPSITAGTWHPTVTVSNGTLSAHVSFAWTVSSKAGPVSGFVSKCVDDYRGRTANGTKVDLWTCDKLARQRITFQANGELRLSGKCITDKNGVTVLEPCTGVAAQIWTRRSNGEYVVRYHSLCLTVPSSSSANGTQLRLAGCSDFRRQRWSLP